MVFFTSIIIVSVLYYLQSDGLIYVTIIALVAELINIFMTQTLTKSVEGKMKVKYNKIVDVYKKKILMKEKEITEFERLQEDSAKRLYQASAKIRAYEEKLGIENSETEIPVPEPSPKEETTQQEKNKADDVSDEQEFVDLPPGSNRKQTPT